MTQFEKMEAALCAFREMRGDDYEGMVAVLCVLRNRMQEGWFGGSLHRNVTAHNQFSSMTIHGDPETIVYPTAADLVAGDFAEILKDIDAVFDGTLADTTHGALYYAVESESSSAWYRDNVSNNPAHPVVHQIGKTTFRK